MHAITTQELVSYIRLHGIAASTESAPDGWIWVRESADAEPLYLEANAINVRAWLGY